MQCQSMCKGGRDPGETLCYCWRSDVLWCLCAGPVLTLCCGVVVGPVLALCCAVAFCMQGIQSAMAPCTRPATCILRYLCNFCVALAWVLQLAQQCTCMLHARAWAGFRRQAPLRAQRHQLGQCRAGKPGTPGQCCSCWQPHAHAPYAQQMRNRQHPGHLEGCMQTGKSW